MKVGVTGAAGFIGPYLLDQLRKRGHEPVAFVRNTPAPGGFESRPLDITASGIDGAFEGLDAIIHGAAYIPVAYRDADQARLCYEVNALGTLNVLRAAAARKLQKAVVLSSNVYRVGAAPVSEDSPIEPSSQAPYYLASKACADFYALHFDRAEGLPTAVLREANVYGPGLARGMIATFAAKLSAGELVTLQNGGRYRADLVCVQDVAMAVVEAAVGSARGAFNIGSGTPVSALEIAQTVAELVGAPKSLIVVESAVGEAPTGFSPLDITRAKRELAYSPRSLAEGLAPYLAWLKDRP